MPPNNVYVLPNGQPTHIVFPLEQVGLVHFHNIFLPTQKAQVMPGNLVGHLAEEALLCDDRVDARAPILTNVHLGCVIEPADDHLKTR